MRSRLVLIFTLIVLEQACAQRLEDIASIVFTKQNRSYLDEVVISRDSVHGAIENHKSPEVSRHYSADIDHDDWAKLLFALRDVPIEDIDGLQSPTMNRAHDGAIHSSILITFKDGSSISHSFDDENPHPDLKPLLDAILEFRVP